MPTRTTRSRARGAQFAAGLEQPAQNGWHRRWHTADMTIRFDSRLGLRLPSGSSLRRGSAGSAGFARLVATPQGRRRGTRCERLRTREGGHARNRHARRKPIQEPAYQLAGGSLVSATDPTVVAERPESVVATHLARPVLVLSLRPAFAGDCCVVVRRASAVAIVLERRQIDLAGVWTRAAFARAAAARASRRARVGVAAAALRQHSGLTSSAHERWRARSVAAPVLATRRGVGSGIIIAASCDLNRPH